MSKHKRKDKDVRREELLNVALKLAHSHGYKAVTPPRIAEECKVSVALVRHYFGTAVQLHRDIIRAAIRLNDVKLIAQAKLLGDPLVDKLDREVMAEVRGCIS